MQTISLQRIVLILIIQCCLPLLSAVDSTKLTVGTTVDTVTPAVTFTWDTQAEGGTMEILRRDMGKVGTEAGQGFVLVGTVSHPTTTFTDSSVAVGGSYEYCVHRPAFSSYAETAAYLAITVDAPLVDERGGVLLVVDETIAGELPAELAQLELDLTGDGWRVTRLDTAPQGVGDPAALKAAIVAACTADPTIKALYLFGRIPVVRSGMIAPDGHTPYRAHETDLYYADLDGSWTDTTIDYGDPGLETENVPGDGKFDQDRIPSSIELMVGRVDFHQMTAHRKNEIEYLRDYLQKSHAWRHAWRHVSYSAFNGSDGYLFQEHNWQRPMFGDGFAAEVTGFQPASAETGFLWGVDFGNWNGYDETAYGAVSNKVVFSINFGSYKQMWARGDNCMRALLCQPDWGLSSCWGARPSWHFHHMAAGLPLGYSAMRTINNGFDSEYSYSMYYQYVSTNLLGDPTLRLHPVAAPEILAVTSDGDSAVLNWVRSGYANHLGWYLYRASDRLGPYTRLTSSLLPATTTTYTDSSRPPGDVYYQLRAVARTSVTTGSYHNQSQGTFAQLRADNSANTLSADGSLMSLQAGSNVPCPIDFTTTDADGDRLFPIVLTNPEHGMLRWNRGVACYVSARGFTGIDNFNYRLSDGINLSPIRSCIINVGENADDLLIGWQFGSPADGVPQDLTCSATHPDIQASSMSIGSGLSPMANAGVNANALWLADADATSLDADDYVQWSLSPTAGNVQSLDRLVFFNSAGEHGYSAAIGYDPYDLELR